MPERPSKPPPRAQVSRSARPRRVRGGLRLSPATAATSWASRRWMDLVESQADGADMAEGVEYARLGQTRSLQIEPGLARAAIQGRAERPYETAIRFRPISPEAWERIARAMAEQARYAAKILAGDLPQEIEELFERFGERLCPSGQAASGASGAPGGAADARPSCTCHASRAKNGWCKHDCCLAYLLADRIARDPMVLFTLRGVAAEDFLDRLRHSRAAAGAEGATPLYTPVVRGASDVPSIPLDRCLERFWSAGRVPEPDLPVEPPPVSHPLLRRLGPSPFKDGQFPLVGLLATCYEVISERTIRQEMGDSET